MNGVKGLHLVCHLQENSSAAKRVRIGQLHHQRLQRVQLKYNSHQLKAADAATEHRHQRGKNYPDKHSQSAVVKLSA